MKHTALSLIIGAGYIVKGVLLLLLLFSVVSWGIIIFKWRYFSRARRESEDFARYFRAGKDAVGLNKVALSCSISPIANIYNAVYEDKTIEDKEGIRMAIRRYGALENAKLERYLSFLATAGSTAPFIGLFGTVWGIMDSFQNIGAAGSASLAVVAPGIAEALIATAIGLATAIPAVIGYNYYLSMARRMSIEMEDFSEELLFFFQRLMYESRKN